MVGVAGMTLLAPQARADEFTDFDALYDALATCSSPFEATLTGDIDAPGGTLTVQNIVIESGPRLTIDDSASIGGAQNAKIGDITITGATVEATGGAYAAGIGGGNFSREGGKITIDSAKVTATAGNWASGIGGGARGDGDTISITESTVDVVGGYADSGIGGGGADGTAATVSIRAATVNITTGAFGSGIGAGYALTAGVGDGATVDIDAGAV